MSEHNSVPVCVDCWRGRFAGEGLMGAAVVG